MSDKIPNHVPLPPDIHAFVCARCGAVALSPENVCEVQGRLKRGDWCGTESLEPASFCKSRVHNIRYKCQKCGRVAINPGLLCEPEQMPKPSD
jgi:predicted RNA-binding Zn-ribbon protein involved in translation (DUF1610 family)